MLNVFEYIPDGLLDLEAGQLHQLLNGPALLHLPGERSPAVFISVLLHGNEHTGWEVMRRLLASYSGKPLPRSVSIFIGNIEAAKHNRRFLDHQQDYNRVWDDGDTLEHTIMDQVVEEMMRREVLFSIDIHNNTGKNPHYACINSTHPEFIQLATMFSSTVVYFLRPGSVQSMRFSKICPAVTVECGLSGERGSVEHALDFVENCIQLEGLSDHAISSDEFDLYHTVGVVKIPADILFGFNKGDYDVVLKAEIEQYNFTDMPAGTVIGDVLNDNKTLLNILDEQGNDVREQYFTIEHSKLVSRRSFVPAMITLDSDAIRKDCFCYIMERYPL